MNDNHKEIADLVSEVERLTAENEKLRQWHAEAAKMLANQAKTIAGYMTLTDAGQFDEFVDAQMIHSLAAIEGEKE